MFVFNAKLWRAITIFPIVLWYILTSTHLMYVLMDTFGAIVMVEQVVPNCAAMGCGCSLDEPDRICCCTGQKVGIVHGSSPQTAKPTKGSYLSAAYCAGGFPDPGTQHVSFSLHLLPALLFVFPVLLFLCFFPTRSFAPLAGISSLPDKIPI
jgi:hypothetical protein